MRRELQEFIARLGTDVALRNALQRDPLHVLSNSFLTVEERRLVMEMPWTGVAIWADGIKELRHQRISSFAPLTYRWLATWRPSFIQDYLETPGKRTYTAAAAPSLLEAQIFCREVAAYSEVPDWVRDLSRYERDKAELGQDKVDNPVRLITSTWDLRVVIQDRAEPFPMDVPEGRTWFALVRREPGVVDTLFLNPFEWKLLEIAKGEPRDAVDLVAQAVEHFGSHHGPFYTRAAERLTRVGLLGKGG